MKARVADHRPASRDAIPFLSPDMVRSHRAHELRDSVQRVTVVHEVQPRRGEPDGLVATTQIGSLDLVFVRYGTEVTVDAFPARNRFTLTIPLGPMRVSNTNLSDAETMSTGFVLSQERNTLMNPDPAAGALVFSTSMARLEEQLTGLAGRPPAGALRFLSPEDGPAVGPAGLVESGWRMICQTLADSGGEPLSPLVARKLEDVLLSAVLLGLPHSGTDDLLADDIHVPVDLPDRARRWLEDRYEEPVTVTDLAAAVGISVRHLQYVFGARFGLTPTEMLRDIRLRQAHRILRDTSATTYPTVAAVAHRCGFSHLGRFSIAYRERFGESPSQTLRRVHGRIVD
ncbi:MAG TPA: AraC family transcriptional regulator [Trebonia sp.]